MGHTHSHSSAEEQLDCAISTLREHGHRITGPRKAILSILIAEHGPFSAEDLHQRLPAGEGVVRVGSAVDAGTHENP